MPFASEEAREIGTLLGRTCTSDVVDGHLVVIAARAMSTVLTSDTDDLRQLSAHLPTPVEVRGV